MFAKRHYEAIAKILRENADWRPSLAWSLIGAFKSDNPRFDEDRFLKAVGLK